MQAVGQRSDSGRTRGHGDTGQSGGGEGERACIQIADTGIGIEEGDSEKIFDMFYRTSLARDKEKVGTGLGLTIVSRIIRLHKGEITFRPGAERGTVFTIKLPRIHLEE